MLNKGVIIHCHDIFTPRDYPEYWLKNYLLLWNEQYLFEALMTNSDSYEVLFDINFLKNNHYAKLKSVCPYLRDNNQPSSFHIIKK